MAYEAEIRTVRGREPDAAPPSIVVAHRRAGTAELKLDDLSGGRLLHLALAGCVFNNVMRMAKERGIEVEEASVRVGGGFTEDGASTGMDVHVDVRAGAPEEVLRRLAGDAYANSTVVAALQRGARVSLA